MLQGQGRVAAQSKHCAKRAFYAVATGGVWPVLLLLLLLMLPVAAAAPLTMLLLLLLLPLLPQVIGPTMGDAYIRMKLKDQQQSMAMLEGSRELAQLRKVRK